MPSTEDIYLELEIALQRFQKEYHNGRLFVDLECFRATAPHINWNKLLDIKSIDTANNIWI
jgi:hypothetical protein